MIVLDSSALLTAVREVDDGRAIRLALVEHDIAAPHIIDIEFLAACRNLRHRDEIDDHEADRLLGHSRAIPIERFDHRPLLSRAWEMRANLTPYDASYVALAEALRAPLYTSDAAIAGAPGVACEVRVFPS